MTSHPEYGVIVPKPFIVPKGLLKVPHKGKVLTVSYPAFHGNLHAIKESIGKNYLHPTSGKPISFRLPTTSESISTLAYVYDTNLEGKFNKIILGTIYKAQDGVFVNLPPEAFQNLKDGYIDEKFLMTLLIGTHKLKVGKGFVHLGENDFGFANYSTFSGGMQDRSTLIESGLAMVLEHTEDVKKIRSIADSINSIGDVYVNGFNSQTARTRTVILNFEQYLGRPHLRLDENSDHYSEGSAYCVLNKDESQGDSR